VNSSEKPEADKVKTVTKKTTSSAKQKPKANDAASKTDKSK
jgi:hypothetical protein